MCGCMCGFRNFCQGGPRPTARKQLLSSFFLSPKLILQFYSGLSMVYFEENFPRFQRGSNSFQLGGGSNIFQGGGGTFSRGGPTFYRGGGGSNFFQRGGGGVVN